MSNETAKLESTDTPNKWLSRKLWLTVAFCVAATVLAVKLDASLIEWGTVAGGVLTAYMGGNAAEHWAKRPQRME